MKPGLDSIVAACAALGDPQYGLRAIHVAGTNGKGAVCAFLDSCLRAAGLRVGRYTSPHLVRLNERFFLDGSPMPDDAIDESAARVAAAVANVPACSELTFFEALTAVAFDLYAKACPDYVILETGLGGRLDATNVCSPVLTVITRIGLDHCDWLGSTVSKIAAEKGGIIKAGVPVVVGENSDEALDVIRGVAHDVGAPFIYAPEVASRAELPGPLGLAGEFNLENAVTALAALKTLGVANGGEGFRTVAWPGRFQRVGNFIVDGAHNPPAAAAIADSLRPDKMNLIAGFCGDKDVDEVLRTLAPLVVRGFAVKTANPRSLSAAETCERMRSAGIDAVACPSLAEALSACGTEPTLVAGSLFLAGEALVALGAYPFGDAKGIDPSEALKAV